MQYTNAIKRDFITDLRLSLAIIHESHTVQGHSNDVVLSLEASLCSAQQQYSQFEWSNTDILLSHWKNLFSYEFTMVDIYDMDFGQFDQLPYCVST